MKYSCHDIFMVRVPSLPALHAKNYIESEISAIDYIYQKELEDFFGEALLVSSQSLHEAFYDENQNEKN